MFDKKSFSHILEIIISRYDSISEFANISTVGRSYISKYIHFKIDAPPTPKVLEKIANASKNVTTYEELMQICGYYNDSLSVDTVSKIIFKENIHKLDKYNLQESEVTKLEEILTDRKCNESVIDDYVRNISVSSFENGLSIRNLYEDIEKILFSINELQDRYKKAQIEYPIPLYSEITDGKSMIKIDGVISKYITLNLNLEKITDLIFYFGVIASDSSMAPLLDVGDIAIIKETMQYEKGGTYLLRVNDGPFIIRKIIEVDNEIELLAMNPYFNVSSKKLPKDAKLEIFGRVIKAENQSAFK